MKSSQLNLLKVQLTEMRVVLKKTVPPYAIQELPQCGSRTEPAEGSEVRCCNRECSILNESSFCDSFSSAEVLVVVGRNRVCLSAFGDMVAQLLGCDDVAPSEEGLLRSPPIVEMKYRHNEILKVVRKPNI